MSTPQATPLNPMIAASDWRKQYRKKGGWIVLLVFSCVNLVFWAILFLSGLFITKENTVVIISSVICAISLGLIIFTAVMMGKVSKHNAAVTSNHKSDLEREKATRQAMQEYQRSQFRSEQSSNTKAAQFYRECQRRGIHSLDAQRDLDVACEILQYNQQFARMRKTEDAAKALFIQGKNDIEAQEQQKREAENAQQYMESTVRDYVGNEGYRVIEAARSNVIPEELFLTSLLYIADITDKNMKSRYMYVFKGKSGILSYFPDNNQLIPCSPIVLVEEIKEPNIIKKPDTLIYTGVTVGGITTGGFDTIKGKTHVYYQHTGNYAVVVGFGSKQDVVHIIRQMWCNDPILKFLDYNGWGSHLSSSSDNYEIRIDAPNQRLIQIGISGKTFCDCVQKAMLQR